MSKHVSKHPKKAAITLTKKPVPVLDENKEPEPSESHRHDHLGDHWVEIKYPPAFLLANEQYQPISYGTRNEAEEMLASMRDLKIKKSDGLPRYWVDGGHGKFYICADHQTTMEATFASILTWEQALYLSPLKEEERVFHY